MDRGGVGAEGKGGGGGGSDPVSYDIFRPQNIEPGFNLVCDNMSPGSIYRCEILKPPIKY